MTPAVTAAKPVDLDELQAANQKDLDELQERRQALALDALSDPKAGAELAELENEISAAESQLERIGLARSERERRDVAADEAAEAKRKAKALNRARELQADRNRAAEEFDEAATALVAATEAYYHASVDQRAELESAGHSLTGMGNGFKPVRLEMALRYHARQRRRAREVLSFLPTYPPAACRPLAELTSQLVEPKESRSTRTKEKD